MKAGEFPPLESSFNIQTLIEGEDLELSSKDFANLVRSVEQQMDTVSQETQGGLDAIANKASKQLSKSTDQKVDMNIGETQMLGIHDQGPHHVKLNASLTSWRTAIQAANPIPSSGAFGGFLQNKIIRGALVGGLLGGIVGLIGALPRKRRANAA